MSMKNELKELQRQQREELTNLHRVYVRTKRDVARQMSPDRFVRRHLGATLSVATLAGLLLAPRPGPRRQAVAEPSPATSPAGGNSMAHLFKKILAPLMGMAGIATEAPPEAAQSTNGHSAPPSAAAKIRGLLPTLLTVLAGRIDIHRLLSELMRTLVQLFHEARAAKGAHSEPPHVSAADVGTVRPDQFETDYQ